MAPEFCTFYILGLSYLGVFSPLLCLMCLPTQFPFPILIWSAPCPSGSKHLINAYIMKTGNHVYILCKRKENCYRMRAFLVYSFVVVVLPPQRPLVFFLVFTYVQGRQVYHMTPLYTVEILGHWWLARKTWLEHAACWSQDRQTTKWEISSCLIYCGYSHTVKRCAIFWKH